MRGFGFVDHGGPDRLRFVDVPRPDPGPGDVAVRIAAAAFNRLDRFVLEGIPGVPIERPHVLGSDASGWVDAVGAGVEGLVPGTRVLVNPGLWDATCDACRAGDESRCRNFRIVGEHTQGSVTERLVVPARNVHPIPASLSFPSAAAAPLVFQTAWRALATIGAVRPGETLAIVGAGGGVAPAAVQIGRLLGARVVVASRSPAKAERALALGADAAVTFDDDHPLDRVLWSWSEKRGIDVIFDSVGRPTVGRSVRALARGGRVVVIGATAGPLVELDLRTLFWRQASVRGSTMASRAEFATVLDHVVAGRLTPVIDRVVPFEDAATGFLRFDAPDLFGKVVVEGPSGPP